jgi:hypothetical protein
MSKVFFIHFRNVDGQSRISNFGGSTVAFREVADGVEYAVARCNSRDNFNKGFGRAKAQGRLNSDRFRQKFSGSVQQFHDTIAASI